MSCHAVDPRRVRVVRYVAKVYGRELARHRFVEHWHAFARQIKYLQWVGAEEG